MQDFRERPSALDYVNMEERTIDPLREWFVPAEDSKVHVKADEFPADDIADAIRAFCKGVLIMCPQEVVCKGSSAGESPGSPHSLSEWLGADDYPTLCLVVTDLKDATALTPGTDDYLGARLIEKHLAKTEALAQQESGRILKYTGDGAPSLRKLCLSRNWSPAILRSGFPVVCGASHGSQKLVDLPVV